MSSVFRGLEVVDVPVQPPAGQHGPFDLSATNADHRQVTWPFTTGDARSERRHL